MNVLLVFPESVSVPRKKVDPDASKSVQYIIISSYISLSLAVPIGLFDPGTGNPLFLLDNWHTDKDIVHFIIIIINVIPSYTIINKIQYA